MTREFSVVIEKDEDGYFVAWVPALLAQILRDCELSREELQANL